MAKDFITIDVREPEYKVLRAAFEAWGIESFFGNDISEKDLKYTLYKLGFGDIVDTYLNEAPEKKSPTIKSGDKFTISQRYEIEEPIAPVPSEPIEEIDPFILPRYNDYKGPKY